ncbi:MAG: ABC transporter permease subunit [Candidatus Krumholzibacteriota bacterium]|nr:ABC transporter permease subunit [Candidatus Krumholzibacteriota bacterium]
MLRTLILKELKFYFTSPKFIFTFAACGLLILLSVSIGIQGYKNDIRQYDTSRALEKQVLAERTSWAFLATRTFIYPDPMRIIVAGVTNDIGRFSLVSATEQVALRSSAYSNDPIFAVFRLLDLNFIFLVVLSLFAILFTYDAINGERESGTLRLTFSNAVPRVSYIAAKFAGAWLGLVIPLLIPLLVVVLLLILAKIPFSAAHWFDFSLFIGISLVYFTFFISLGILVSASTRHASTSFLVLLVAWVSLTLIVPRLGVMAAGKIMPVPSTAEINSIADAYSKGRWKDYTDRMIEISRARNTAMADMTEQEREAYREENEWTWMEESDGMRKELQSDIKDNTRRLQEEQRNRLAGQERLAFTLSRFSPASAFQLAAMKIAGTDTGLKPRYQESIEKYRDLFLDHARVKEKATGGGMGGININFDSEKGISVSTPRGRPTIETSDMPLFMPPEISLGTVLSSTITDFVLLIIYTSMVLAAAFVAFLRYDVR